MYFFHQPSKLLDPKRGLTILKSYLSILKTFLNNKKIPCVPPLLHQNKLIANIKEKAEMMNEFFTPQCMVKQATFVTLS